MKVKQKSVRVFEIECESLPEFEAYLDKNSVLLNGFLLLLRGDTKGAFAKECKKRKLCYALVGECDDGALIAKKEPTVALPEPDVTLKQETKVETPIVEVVTKKQTPKPQAPLPLEIGKAEAVKEPIKTVVVVKNLRSGEDINTDADVMITGRINSGAKVKTNGNATILDVVDGDVEAWGEYLVVKSIGKGTVSFRGVRVDKELLNGKAKLVTFDGKLSLKDI
jgi:septum formation inhibitor MinC